MRCSGDVPLRFKFLECFPLGVVADDFGVDEAAQVELLGAELRHRGRMYASILAVNHNSFEGVDLSRAS